MEASEPGQRDGRILLIDDDAALGGYLTRVLRERGGFDVTHELDPADALRRVGTEQWDLVITDLELPNMSGLELLERVHELVPGLPVAVITGHPSVEAAVSALRAAAVEFLSKPVSPRELVAKVTGLIAADRAARAARAAGRESVLASGAHPEDVEIGAPGGPLAHRAAGDTVAILTRPAAARARPEGAGHLTSATEGTGNR